MMKKVHIIAIVLGILCALAFTGCSIFSALNGDPEKKEPEKESQVQKEEEQKPLEDSEKEPEKESEKEPEKEPEKDAEKEPEKESNKKPEKKPETTTTTTDNSDLAGYKGNANTATVTKEEAKKILNDPYMLLVNRDHVLSSDFKGVDLVSYNSDHRLTDICSKALRRIISDGKKAGYNYVLYSGYRSYSHQYNNYYNRIANYKKSGYSEEEAIRLTNQYVAPPGASEHHTGLAADVCIPSILNKYNCLHENYEYTDEYKWFSAHAHEYGFILRYRKGDEGITGYNFEPWHYRYVGVDIATEIHRRDITLEEYVQELENVLNS